MVMVRFCSITEPNHPIHIPKKQRTCNDMILDQHIKYPPNRCIDDSNAFLKPSAVKHPSTTKLNLMPPDELVMDREFGIEEKKFSSAS